MYLNKEQLEAANNIYKHYGKHHQTEMLVEEMAELTQAIQKEKRCISTENAMHRIEETADVLIVLSQMLYNMSANEVKLLQEQINYKLHRTNKIIKGELI